MVADESALVPISPDDSIDTIATKVRSTGATSIQLLVPDGTAALQSLGGFERLLKQLDPERVSLLVISSDDQTLNAARLNRIETVGVQGARVTLAPPANGNAADRYATRTLPAEPLDMRDVAFLDALDNVQPRDRYADIDADDADLYAALDDLSDTFQQQGTSGRAADTRDEQGLTADEDFAAALDDWSLGEDQAPTQPSPRSERAPEPPRRFSAADFDLTEQDIPRQRGSRQTSAQRARTQAKTTAVASTAARRQRNTTSSRLRDYDDEEAVAPRRRSLSALIPIAIVVALALALVFWFLSSRTTLTVAPPATAASEHAFQNEVIPLAQIGENATTAVQASSVSADAEASVTGTVEQETLSPAGTAAGQITLINTIESPVPIPRGAEFIGKNASGEDVRFTLDADATVPPAVTTSSATGRNTTYGQIVVGITARSPGGASNVDANSITQLLIPGQQPIVSQNSNFIFQNAPITGGNEQPQRIVTEADVQAVLGKALSALYINGMQQLKSQIDETQAGIEPITITPSTTDLADPKFYEQPVVEPAVGQPVDPSNPVFKVTVRSHFNALAAPLDNPVDKQLGVVVRDHFQALDTSPCRAGDIPSQRVDNVRWDGEKLTIDGVTTCSPPQVLSPEAIGKVRDAVRGQSRDAAEAGLQVLQQNGVIGAYQLPDKSAFPRFDWLITVQAAEPQPQPEQQQPEQSQTEQPQPTQTAP